MNKNSASQPKFQPFVPAGTTVPEVTWKAVILGALIAVVFGLANANLGLRFGMTVSASIPAAVISMAVLRALFKKVTVLENNIVQTIGSSGESLAAGVGFTIPVFFIWSASSELAASGYQLTITKMQIFWFAILGGTLGILLMIPLRRYLVDREHGKLAFPEGTACAEVIIAGDEGGERARLVVTGIALGGLFKTLGYMLKVWPESIGYNFRSFLKGGVVGIDAAPALMGVGYIIGLRIAALMMGGAVLGYLGIGPLLAFIGDQIPGVVIAPGRIPISEMGAADLRNNYIKYLGVGAVALGGFVSLIKALPVVVSSFQQGFGQLLGKKLPTAAVRTDRD
ncbi:MAG TPA: oligopeptide transporter, OPT family, partial [Candidatus Deferrimicrobium sp.]|nr:oligopeptide transporter, OPT family [Candidatus Deferrimicrobium sp.]